MNILIVDDHVILLEALAAMLTRLIPGAQVRTARDIAEARTLNADGAVADVLLLDLFLPGIDGMGAVTAFRASDPALPIIVLSASADPDHAKRALAAGALGYVPKSASPKTLLSAIQMVMNGDVYVPPLLLADPVPGPAPRAPRLGLTARQEDVLRLIARGSSNKEIGLSLGLSEKTVKVHVAAIFRRLGVTRRMEAAERARAAALV